MQQTVDSIVKAIQEGRNADALTLARTLVQSFPDDQGVLSLLAVSEQNAGDLEAARRILERLTNTYPETWQHWNNLGNVRRLQGDATGAAEAYAKALEGNSESPRLLANLGLLALNAGHFPKARAHLCGAITKSGAEPSMRVWAAVACHAMADDSNAALLVEGWQTWPPIGEEAMLELGWLLFQLGDPPAAELVLASEFRDSSLRVRALIRRVLARERLNRIDEATQLARLLPDPTQISDNQVRAEVFQALASLAGRQKQHGAARDLYEAALELGLPERYRRPICLALARTCDALDDVQGTINALGDAHSTQIEAQISEESVALAGTGLLALLDTPPPADPLPVDSSTTPTREDSPIFVVGFPRSGTTLLEQMLAAHPNVVSADEKPILQMTLQKLRGVGSDYPASLNALTDADRDELRRAYWAEAGKHVNCGPATGQRLVDKHPLNFLALPLIRSLFPNAAVILCRRHPCDSLLSSLMQDFRDPRLAAECASMQRLARLYVRLAERWRLLAQQFPEHLLICRHEDLVAETDASLRRISTFTGLADVEAMRSFDAHARNRGFIGTPSYSQVVSGINPEAAGRWNRYQDYLAPVLPVLAPIIEEWGYAS